MVCRTCADFNLSVILWKCSCVCVCVFPGPRELHPGADSVPSPAQVPGGVLLLLLRLHCCAQVFLLPGSCEDR